MAPSPRSPADRSTSYIWSGIFESPWDQLFSQSWNEGFEEVPKKGWKKAATLGLGFPNDGHEQEDNKEDDTDDPQFHCAQLVFEY
jgi:hypothetical protein